MRSRRLTEPPRPCDAGERNPSARFAGTSPFRGGLKWCGQRPPCAKRTFPRRAFPPLSTGPSLKTERFQRGRWCGDRREPRPGRPSEAPPTQAICQRGVRGPARRMETLPAPGSLWFLSPAGKELARPQTCEIPLEAASSPSPVCLLFPHLTLKAITAQFVGSVGDAFSAICCLQIFRSLPPVNLQNLPLHLTKNSFASAPTHLCGIALIPTTQRK